MNLEDYITERESNGKSSKRKGLWATLSSMKFAIWTLILLGALSLIALFIGELRDPQAAKGATGAGSALMMLLQMDDPFRSWWYRLLLGVLCLSLFTCIIERFPVIWRLWTKTPSSDVGWLKNVRHGIVRSATVKREDLQRRLTGWTWRVKTDSLWIGERGRVGIWGPIFTHLGMLLIGVGALVGSFGGLRTRDGGFAGDVVRLANTDFSVRIDSFRVIYYPLQPGQWVLVQNEWIGRLDKQNSDGTWQVRQVWRDGEGEPQSVPADQIRNRFSSQMDRGNIQKYASYVTVFDDDGDSLQTEIVVNSPLRHNGYRFYQSSYDPDRPRFQASYETLFLSVSDSAAGKFDTLMLKPGEEIPVPGDSLSVMAGRLLPDFKLGQAGAYSESADFINPAVELRFRGANGFEKKQWAFLRFPSHESGPGRFTYRITSLAGERASEEMMTIWEIKKTYGGWILWAGFIFGTLGLLLSFYLSHRVLYVEWTGAASAKLTGLTRKTIHLYARDLDHVLENLNTTASS